MSRRYVNTHDSRAWTLDNVGPGQRIAVTRPDGSDHRVVTVRSREYFDDDGAVVVDATPKGGDSDVRVTTAELGLTPDRTGTWTHVAFDEASMFQRA